MGLCRHWQSDWPEGQRFPTLDEKVGSGRTVPGDIGYGVTAHILAFYTLVSRLSRDRVLQNEDC